MGKFTQSVLNVPYNTPFKLVEKGSVTIADGDTSTTATKIKDCGFELKDDCLYYFISKRKQKAINTYYSTTSVYIAYKSTASATNISVVSNGTREITGASLDAFTRTTGGSNGVYFSISSNKAGVYKKYNSSGTPNWSGDYEYEIYEVDLSNQGE